VWLTTPRPWPNVKRIIDNNSSSSNIPNRDSHKIITDNSSTDLSSYVLCVLYRSRCVIKKWLYDPRSLV
jgi:hypothetical protein